MVAVSGQPKRETFHALCLRLDLKEMDQTFLRGPALRGYRRGYHRSIHGSFGQKKLSAKYRRNVYNLHKVLFEIAVDLMPASPIRPIDPDSLRTLGIYPALKKAGIHFQKRASGCHAFR